MQEKIGHKMILCSACYCCFHHLNLLKNRPTSQTSQKCEAGCIWLAWGPLFQNSGLFLVVTAVCNTNLYYSTVCCFPSPLFHIHDCAPFLLPLEVFALEMEAVLVQITLKLCAWRDFSVMFIQMRDSINLFWAPCSMAEICSWNRR